MDDSLFQAGIDARTRVLGPEFVTKAFSTADSFNRDMQEMVTEYCWGGVWGRTALTDQPAKPQQPVHPRLAESLARIQVALPRARCATAARSTNCATR